MTERDEAEFVIREIMKHQRNGKKYQDMAILYRTNAQSRVLEETFMNLICHTQWLVAKSSMTVKKSKIY